MSSFLDKHKRQPKLYIDLPSKAEFYNDSTLEGGQYVQMPVFGMTAMDEILFKTPDALFSGEATAQVISSCIPCIVNPWDIVGYDMDYVLIAIRIATYGDNMGVNTKCPHCGESTESEVSLTNLLSRFSEYPVRTSFDIGDLTVHLKPLSYKTVTEFSLEQFRLERSIASLEKNNEMTREDKDRTLNELLLEITKLNLRLAVSHIESISSGDDIETDNASIFEFIADNDATFYNSLKESIKQLTERWKLPKFEIQCTNETCQATYQSRIDMDYSNFFDRQSLHSVRLR